MSTDAGPLSPTLIIMARMMRDKVYEPQQRNKDGMRWIKHRFPIKGGISFREVMAHNFTADNKLIAIIRSVGNE